MTIIPTDYDLLVSRAFDAPTWEERHAACATLKSAGPLALPALERRLHDPRWQARRQVAQLLDNALDQVNVHVLLRALKDPNASVRRNSLHSLVCETCKPEGCWSVDTTGVLIEIVLNDRSPRVRCAAISYLSGRPPEPRIIDALRQVQAVHDHQRVRNRSRMVAQQIAAQVEQARGHENAEKVLLAKAGMRGNASS